MFWQGGFTFYAAVVVPTGQQVLGSHLEQGLITRQVTYYLNVSGAVALAVLAAELLLAADYPRQLRAKLQWVVWAGMAGVLAILVVMHPMLDRLIDLETHTIADRASFRTFHRMYLWISTLEWGLAWIYLWLRLKSWRMEDSRT
jgi:hypothetical protein